MGVIRGFIFLGCSILILAVINPLFRTENGIRRYLLRITPIGTSMEDVIRIANDNDRWEVKYTDMNYGFTLYPNSSFPSRAHPRTSPRSTVIGEKSMRVHLGTFDMIIRFDVTAWYAFDADGKLIEIRVRREFDVL